MQNLTDRFIEGLKKYDLTIDDIQNNDYRYVGGDTGRHLNYWKMKINTKLPNHENRCVCNKKIKENCYIRDKYGDILVLGNCCIKKFIKKSTRTCDKCGEPHRNRIVDRCKKCRKGVCDNCGKKCDLRYKKCYDCESGHKEGFCDDCDKKCDYKYRKWYDCNQKYKDGI